MPEQECHLIREMPGAWSLKTNRKKHSQSDPLNQKFLPEGGLQDGGGGEKKGKKPPPTVESKLKVTEGCASRQFVNPLPLS